VVNHSGNKIHPSSTPTFHANPDRPLNYIAHPLPGASNTELEEPDLRPVGNPQLQNLLLGIRCLGTLISLWAGVCFTADRFGPRSDNQITASEAQDMVLYKIPKDLPPPNVPLADIYGRSPTISYCTAKPYKIPKHPDLANTTEVPMFMPAYNHLSDYTLADGASTLLVPDMSSRALGLLAVLVGIIGTATFTLLWKRWIDRKNLLSEHELIDFLQCKLEKATTKNADLAWRCRGRPPKMRTSACN
jgi:hypothetical protein